MTLVVNPAVEGELGEARNLKGIYSSVPVGSITAEDAIAAGLVVNEICFINGVLHQLTGLSPITFTTVTVAA